MKPVLATIQPDLPRPNGTARGRVSGFPQPLALWLARLLIVLEAYKGEFNEDS